ncbi:MAG: helix-turn-helix domain-containing protein, partial [Oscillospiraceae bacterium]|nr:helix-turn-helix domain-containing protein [Oscillospiraceae bacterium]
NEEWDYLLDYGYASNAAFQYARTSSRFFEILHTGSGVFYYASTPNQPTESLTVCIKSNDIPWGYITSVGVEDKYRHGEIDALFCLSKIIEANIPIKNETINDDFSKNVFKEYLTNPEADNLENLRRLISSYGWNPADHYCAVCAFFDNANIENIHRMYATAVNILDLPCVFVSNLLVFILCHDDMLYDNSAAQIRQISDNFNASLIFSMPVPDIRNIYYAYDQAQFVISRGKLEPKTLYLFYDYAVDYLISHCEQKALLSACKKEIVQLVRGRQKDMDMARTLEAYLLQERSLQRTSSVMHLHRNTVSYRIQKLSENSYIDLDSTYDREYIKFSFAVLRYFNFM